MAKKTKKSVARVRRDWTLLPGVGFDGNRVNEHGYPAAHYVVLMCSMQGGVDVFGPFLNEESAHSWIRSESDAEMYNRYETAREPGVYFTVKWLDVPKKYKD